LPSRPQCQTNLPRMAPQVSPEPGDVLPRVGRVYAAASAEVCGRAYAATANAINFAMGLAWLALTGVIAAESFSSEPTTASAGALWACAAVASMVLIPLMYGLARLSAKLEQDAEEAKESGDPELAHSCSVMAKSVQTVSSWGCAFGLAGQLSMAAAASVPASPWSWRLVYTVFLMLTFVAVSALVAVVGRRCTDHRSKRVLRSVVDNIISGSAYAVALGFINTAIAAFTLNDLTSSDDLGYLAIFSSVTLIVTTVGLALLVRGDAGAVQKASAEVAEAGDGEGGAKTNAASAAGGEGDAVAPPIWVQQLTLVTSLRKLFAKTLSMCGVVVTHCLLYVSLARMDLFSSGSTVSVYDPLPIGDALIFLLISLVAAILGGALIEYCLRGAAERLSAVDRAKVPGPFDDALLASLQALAQSTVATVIPALAWLVGYGVHGCAASVWDVMIPSDETTLSVAAQVAVAAAYAILITILAVTFTIRCAPLPAQSA